jgi:predicted CXXCH cytochrome family protein
MRARLPAVSCLAAAAGLTLSAAARAISETQTPTSALTNQARSGAGPATGSTYLGSESCRECHEDQYDTWKKSLHVEMTKPLTEAKVLGDFRPGTQLKQNGRSYAMTSKDGKPSISVAHGDGPPRTFEVHYTLGARRFQGYLSKLPDGRIYVLPVFWRVDTGQWIDYAVIGPVPDGPHEYRQIWNTNCVNCHATNLTPGYSLQTDTYATTWTEMGIGCEACHGPGSRHETLMRKLPASPAVSRDARSRDPDYGTRLATFSPRTAPKRQTFDSCAYCHGNKKNVFLGFTAGERYEDYALPFLLSEPIPANDPQGDYWPDGRPNRFNRPQALMLSACFRKGSITCTDCHRMHGSTNDHALKVPAARTDELCTQCHKSLAPSTGREPAVLTGPGIAAHTHHAPDSPGSRCIECHMSDVNWRLLNRRRDHTFAPPVPEMTAAYGAPNACTTCHDNRTPEWAGGVMDRWYGDGRRRQAALATADVMYQAGVGDPAAIPGLAAIAVNAGVGAVLRASAADFLSTLSPKSSQAVLGPLIKASADPEPIVRAAAIGAIGALGDRRAVPALVPRLSDRARAVRAAAVTAMLQMGVTSLEGPTGVVLSRAQDEYAAGRRTFQDSAPDHTMLGWLQATRGRSNEAEQELAAAIKLDPANPRPFLIRGIMLAQQSKFDEALEALKTARRLAPKDESIPSLISEIERRAKR